MIQVLGRRLEIDTDPGRPGLQGLERNYPAGTEVGELSLVSYAVFNERIDSEGRFPESGRPVLKRKINAGGFEPLAEDIDQLKIRSVRKGTFELLIGARLEPGKETEAERARQALLFTTQVSPRN